MAGATEQEMEGVQLEIERILRKGQVRRVNVLGHRVMRAAGHKTHFCVKCEIPIAEYGRLVRAALRSLSRCRDICCQPQQCQVPNCRPRSCLPLKVLLTVLFLSHVEVLLSLPCGWAL